MDKGNYSYFNTAVSEYVRFCNKQGLSTRNIKDISIDLDDGSISLLDKDERTVAVLNRDFNVTSIIHGVRT
ncbi:MAG: hypothetical protein CMK23_05830 [Porticoccaceae bacterium]|nr:hypothetical protein [Porticoccaceae bacterium]